MISGLGVILWLARGFRDEAAVRMVLVGNRSSLKPLKNGSRSFPLADLPREATPTRGTPASCANICRV